MSIRIRNATVADLEAINDIYNFYVLHSTCTYQESPSTMEERKAWFAAHTERHPVTVVVDERDTVVGWGALNAFHSRCAYRFTVENSIYVHHEHHRQGIGRALLQDLLERVARLGHHSVLAVISADQLPSVELHRAMGFAEVGRFREIGFKFNQWLDVVYLQWFTPSAKTAGSSLSPNRPVTKK